MWVCHAIVKFIKETKDKLQVWELGHQSDKEGLLQVGVAVNKQEITTICFFTCKVLKKESG